MPGFLLELSQKPEDIRQIDSFMTSQFRKQNDVLGIS
jgi:hypothetical protein